jgi:peptide/nickel transport system ATP-binding protein
VGILGESGAGKSTIGRAILGLLDPPAIIESANIKLNNDVISNRDEKFYESIRGKKIGYIFQNPMTALNPVLTIGEQIMETIEANTDLQGKRVKQYALELLEKASVSFAEERLKKYPHQLSGGLCQRIVFAIAIAAKPDLIIADEPTTALDVTVQKSVLHTLTTLCQQENIAIILITHDMGVVSEICNYVYVLRNGKQVEEGPTREVLLKPQTTYSKELMASVPRIDRRLDRFQVTKIGEKINKSTALSYLYAKRLEQKTSDSPLLQVKNLSKTFFTSKTLFKPRKEFQAVKDVSFEVFQGETVGIIGESGSGKSTIGRMILGLHNISTGQIIYKGNDISSAKDKSARSEDHLSMQCIFQDPYSSLNPRMTAGENITYALRVHKMVEKNKTEKLAADLMALVGLEQSGLNKLPHAFSGGQRQRIGIARALAFRPDFIFCDEPTSSLDVSVQASFLNLLKDLQQNFSLTLLFVSHDLAVIRQMCDRVIVMKDGVVLEQNTNENIFENPQHIYTKSLLDAMPRIDFN